MGNKNSAAGIEPTLSNFSSTRANEEPVAENTYTRSMPATLSHRNSPPPFSKRSFTVIERPSKSPDSHVGIPPLARADSASALRSSAGANNNTLSNSIAVSGQRNDTQSSSDDLAHHIVDSTPKDGAKDIPLSTSIIVLFDKEIRTVNINKLFEVTCDSSDSCTHLKGLVNYDARLMKAEFVPQKTFFPNSKIIVNLNGKAITTAACNHSSNISDASFAFYTNIPPPKTVRIKLKDQSNTEQLQIANYYDPLNSLVNWSSRKWGCSGEHVIGLFAEREDGKLTPLKGDVDVINIKDDETIVVEIKD